MNIKFRAKNTVSDGFQAVTFVNAVVVAATMPLFAIAPRFASKSATLTSPMICALGLSGSAVFYDPLLHDERLPLHVLRGMLTAHVVSGV